MNRFGCCPSCEKYTALSGCDCTWGEIAAAVEERRRRERQDAARKRIERMFGKRVGEHP